jgi:glycosyltransferase involved in cell wall biosynthesis
MYCSSNHNIILFRNLKSKNFNLILVLSLMAIIIQSCWNKVSAEHNAKLRKKYKHTQINKIPLSKITVIPIGADHLWNLEAKEIQIISDVFNLVVVGRWQLYKNVHSVLLAIAHSDRIEFKRIHITLLGKSEKTGFQLVADALLRIPKEKVTKLEYITDSELKYLYSSANLVIHPSINEGFGLPAFEAYGEGVPILIHEGTPAAENLLGDPAVLITNMLDLKKIEEKIVESLSLEYQSKDIRREHLIAKSMTWDQMCRSYVDYFIKKYK